jgi:SAM-dependent methyltransferase
MDRPIEVTGPNADQIEFWNSEAANKWVDFNPIIDRMLGPLGRAAIDRANPRPGEHALDVGCGCGDTTLELARRVAPAGAVTGVDISAPMLALARQRVMDAAVPVRVVNADAETCKLPAATFDLVYSRFGVMFFTNPDAAFGNLRAALKPGGRIAFVCWQALDRNPWVGVPLKAARPHLPSFEPPGPEEPGQFSLARPERVERILGAAGFSDARLEPHETTMHVGEGDLDNCVALALKLGPISRLLREAGEQAVPPVAAAVREAVAPYHAGDTLEMNSATWIVIARA